jgi:hypothetical protein
MLAKMHDLKARHDWVHTSLMFEPRGHSVMSGLNDPSVWMATSGKQQPRTGHQKGLCSSSQMCSRDRSEQLRRADTDGPSDSSWCDDSRPALTVETRVEQLITQRSQVQLLPSWVRVCARLSSPTRRPIPPTAQIGAAHRARAVRSCDQICDQECVSGLGCSSPARAGRRSRCPAGAMSEVRPRVGMVRRADGDEVKVRLVPRA